jgi:hypothetical protein
VSPATRILPIVLASLIGGAALGPNAEARPLERSFYSGTTSYGMKLNIQVTLRSSGKQFVKVRKLRDGCFGDILDSEFTRLRGGRFHLDESGTTTSAGYTARVDGKFTGKKASATVHSASGDLFPPAGVAPGTANICDVTTAFELERVGHQKFLS